MSVDQTPPDSSTPIVHREEEYDSRGFEQLVRMQRELNATVDEVIAVAKAEKIDAQIVKGGMLRVAVTPAPC